MMVDLVDDGGTLTAQQQAIYDAADKLRRLIEDSVDLDRVYHWAVADLHEACHDVVRLAHQIHTGDCGCGC